MLSVGDSILSLQKYSKAEGRIMTKALESEDENVKKASLEVRHRLVPRKVRIL